MAVANRVILSDETPKKPVSGASGPGAPGIVLPVQPKPETSTMSAGGGAGSPHASMVQLTGDATLPTTNTPAGGQQTNVTLPNAGGGQQTNVTLPDAPAPAPTVTLPNAATPGVTAGNAGYTLPSAPSADTSAMKAMMAAWQAAANQQAQQKIDYGVNQAVTELQRAEEDAQAQFKEQAESVAKDERQGMDNSALYAEARGDKGGIGQAQYNEIQAAAAQNRLAVQQAQTKLSTDTVRQIADLRAQGEFEKADAMLETAQTYLSQLVQLEQWAMEYGLSAAQFQASMNQWAAEFDMAMAQYKTGVDQWNKEFQYQQNRDAVADKQWAQEMAVTQSQKAQTQRAAMGEALLNAGIMPSAEQLAAMGLSEAQAQQWVIASQLKAAQKQSPAQTYSTTEELYQALQKAGATTKSAAQAQLELMGYDSEYYLNDYLGWLKGQGSGGGESTQAPGTAGVSDRAKQIASSLSSMRGQTNSETNIANSIAIYVDSENLSDADARYLFEYFGYDPDEWLE